MNSYRTRNREQNCLPQTRPLAGSAMRGAVAPILVAAALLLAAPAAAQTSNSWQNVTGNWSTAANWSLGVPTSGTSTYLTFGGAGASSYTSTNDLSTIPFVLNRMDLNSTSSATSALTG